MGRGAKKKKPAAAAGPPVPRQSLPVRQRQRLIDACITALHIYGPSGTTVARVVAIAKLSPGIVRFYFQSKAAMLVASLQFLTTEFEDRVLTPVAALRGQPALALQRLVELYLDPDIASPRKVAVWYAFWGEASARQEYLAICGQKDASFAALVQDLIDRLIESSGRRYLDGDAVALGLIGALEMLWQGFAFEEEANIDRALARRRCMAYLRSVFPREFGSLEDGAEGGRTARGPQDDAADERDRLFRGAWQFAGHEQEIAAGGDFVTLDLVDTRALVVRDAAGAVRAHRNACRSQPHALVAARRGCFDEGSIVCTLHGLAYGLDGRSLRPQDGAGLQQLEVRIVGGMVFVRSRTLPRSGPPPAVAGLESTGPWEPLTDSAAPTLGVDADWTIVMQQLLESRLPAATSEAWAIRWSEPELETVDAEGTIRWSATVAAVVDVGSGPSSGVAVNAGPWRRQFLWPNMLIEQRPGAVSVLQVQPVGAGRSRVQQFTYTSRSSIAQLCEGGDALHRLLQRQLERELAIAASTQQGLTDPGYEADAGAPLSPAVAAFRRRLMDTET